MGNCSSSSTVHPPSNGIEPYQNQTTVDPISNQDKNHKTSASVVNLTSSQNQIKQSHSEPFSFYYFFKT